MMSKFPFRPQSPLPPSLVILIPSDRWSDGTNESIRKKNVPFEMESKAQDSAAAQSDAGEIEFVSTADLSDLFQALSGFLIVFVRAELKTQNSSLRLSSKLEFKASELFEPFDYATFITNLVI